MMTVTDSFGDSEIDYKQKYKALKKRLKLLVYEQECFLEELRKAQRKLFKVAKDRSFLLDRLLLYEKIDDSSGDSDATATSDSDAEPHHRDGATAKRKRVSGHNVSGSLSQSSSCSDVKPGVDISSNIASIILAQQAGLGREGPKKKARPPSKKAKTGLLKSQGGHANTPNPMTREELERHLDAKQNQFNIEKATASLPIDIFSNDNATNPRFSGNNGASTVDDEEDDLVIDLPDKYKLEMD